MLSLLPPANPFTFKLSRPAHQHTPHPPGERATFTVVLADGSNVPASQVAPSNHPPPIAVPHFKEARPHTVFTRQPPIQTRSRPLRSIGGDTEKNSTATPDVFPVLGPFDLLYCIQNGGFAAAWAAKDRTTGRLLCLKTFQSLQDPDVSRSVQTELRMFRRMVKSKGGERGKQFIIELNRSIQHEITVFFAMELMTTDLGTYMYTEPERCKIHARRWMAQIALGIGSLHEMGILHRDIKSENILIDSRENVRIIDFGLSYLNPSGYPLRQGGEYAIEFLGTLPYMAPEVLRNKGVSYHRRRYYGTAVDWWGLGCIFFELESQDHKVLFDTEEDVHAYVDWTQEQPQHEQIYPKLEGLDPVVLDLIKGLLQVQPSIRYSLSDLEKHAYFWHCDRSEFENTAARALERPIRPELVPHSAGEPFGVIEAAKLSSIYDWTNLKLAHLVPSD